MQFLSVTDWIWPISIGLLVGILISARKRHNYNDIVYLEADEFRQNMRKGQLIDIRNEEAFKKERINGSRNFPGRSVFSNLNRLRKDQPVFLYSDTDSFKVRQTAKKFIRKGFQPVYVLKGGLTVWSFPLKND
ncbi:MAG TPA: rhodanese-like domain-containing protein [Bacillota bacterium]|nr:rhodanese-like domain-containing protein [Bacillota bacterium]HPF42111.1 rhodanese-like domain-containing protein [Bacillota bacterium]HPJ85362.1 rhodanese-like domain-containing protein [Bacillota bacterium]HPQ61342.1 rhodanese-like domain-containing protein [Bacillota bacterium]HRX91939.1 rhodanese-like domain-containing protein [Candidatus Izemoplasmatales bacterium]